MFSILHDMSVVSPGMAKIKELVETDYLFAASWTKTLTNKRDKALVRCQSCTKTPEEIGGNPKFMVCGICKTKLDFAVHYCSR